MGRVFKLEIFESPETWQSLLKEEKDIRKRERLQFLYWYPTGQAKTRKALGNLLKRSQFALGQWADTYRTQGLHGLLHRNDRGGHLAPPIPVEIQWPIKEQLAQPKAWLATKRSNPGSRKLMDSMFRFQRCSAR